MFKEKVVKVLSTLSLLVMISSCQTTNIQATVEQEETAEPVAVKNEKPKSTVSELTMVFAGDVMAHSTNYKYGNFDNIWKHISSLPKSADLSFANIEAPVANDLEWSNYPNFNMHTSYVEAAINAGFNVFSLANNHTNDQKLHGMKATKNYFDNREGIWSSGLKDSPSSPLNYDVIETTAKDGSAWKILFVAITEVLNTPIDSGYINYYPSSAKKRAALKEELKKLKAENVPDLFVFSVHTDEPEYILKVTTSHKEFFRELITECGVDIVWANHPHVTKEWEILQPGDVDSGLLDYAERDTDSMIMYANGNTISAQRYAPSFNNPDTSDDNTGDGVMIRVTAKKDSSAKSKKGLELKAEPFFITTYITPSRQYVIRFLDDSFISVLECAEVNNWHKYMKGRKEVMERILEKSKF